jgi:1-acyl-sn-glycerol-3-phosphate acyltransferase
MQNIKTEKVSFWQRMVPRILQSIAWYPGYLMLKIFLRMTVTGKKNVKEAQFKAKREGRAILFISNHVSEFDPILSLTATPPYTWAFPMFWVARPGKLYKDPDFSWRRYIYGDLFFLAWGAQPLKSGSKDYAYALQRHAWLLDNGYSVCIFPEGSYDKNKKRIGGGAGFLMESSNPIVISISISGIEDISSKEFWTRKRKLKVEFGKMIEPKLYLDSSKELPDRYKDAIKRIMNI